MQDLFAQLERQLGEGDVEGSAATLHTIGGSASTVGDASARRRASELEQACAAPIRGAVWKILAGIRLDELRTLCDACHSACRRCSATCRRSQRAEPGAVACPPRIQADPGRSPASAARDSG